MFGRKKGGDTAADPTAALFSALRTGLDGAERVTRSARAASHPRGSRTQAVAHGAVSTGRDIAQGYLDSQAHPKRGQRHWFNLPGKARDGMAHRHTQQARALIDGAATAGHQLVRHAHGWTDGDTFAQHGEQGLAGGPRRRRQPGFGQPGYSRDAHRAAVGADGQDNRVWPGYAAQPDSGHPIPRHRALVPVEPQRRSPARPRGFASTLTRDEAQATGKRTQPRKRILGIF